MRAKIWPPFYLGIVTLLIFIAFSHWAYDDPFITYRYADNLHRGLGFVYNPGEHVLSTTTPLFAILLSLLANLWPDLPHLANLIGAASVSLGALFFWDLGQSWGSPHVKWTALLLYPTFPLLLSTLGAETSLYICLCLGAFAFYVRKQYCLTALLVALAVLTRADGILVGVPLALDYLFRLRRPIPWSAILVFIGLVLPWFIFAWMYFGSPLPATLAAKQHQGAMAFSEGFAPGVLTIAQWHASWPYEFELGLALVGLGALRWSRQWVHFLIWPVLYFLAYALLGVTRYFWYYAPLVPGFLVLVGVGISGIDRWLSHVKDRHRNAAWLSKINPPVLYLIIPVLLFIPQVRDAWQSSTHPDQRIRIYTAAGEWLRANIRPDATVGALEVGIVGYYAQRPVIDFAGLIEPEVGGYLGRNTTYEDAALWAAVRYKPDYLVLQDGLFPRLEQNYSSQYCQSIQFFAGESYGYPANLRIYRCESPP